MVNRSVIRRFSASLSRRSTGIITSATVVALALVAAGCSGARTRVMTDKNRPPPAVDSAPAAMRALSIAISKAGDCDDSCTSDRAVCLPKNATDTFVSDLRSALGKAGFRVTDGDGARGDVSLEVCVRATSGDEKTTFWESTGLSPREFWNPADGDFGKDPDGYLYEVGTTVCATKDRKLVIGRQKSEGYDSGAAAAAVTNRLSACEPLLAMAQSKAGIAPTASAPAAAVPSVAPASSAAPATSASAPVASDPGDEDVIELTDGTRVRGQITKEEPGKIVVIQLQDGRSESIAWGAVVKIAHRTEDDVVHLKDGSFARGTVLKEQPGKVVVIKRTDGRTDTFPWEEVVRVVHGKKK